MNPHQEKALAFLKLEPSALMDLFAAKRADLFDRITDAEIKRDEAQNAAWQASEDHREALRVLSKAMSSREGKLRKEGYVSSLEQSTMVVISKIVQKILHLF